MCSKDNAAWMVVSCNFILSRDQIVGTNGSCHHQCIMEDGNWNRVLPCEHVGQNNDCHYRGLTMYQPRAKHLLTWSHLIFTTIQGSLLLSPFYRWRKWCSESLRPTHGHTLHNGECGISEWKAQALYCYLHSLQWKSAKLAMQS